MKRVGGLFEKIILWHNLLAAAHRAARGKRTRADTKSFLSQLSANLIRVQRELAAGTFPFGRCHQFVIHDPKQRIITAPIFEERVVHHAIMGVCEPVFERFLIPDTFACRKGRGRLLALKSAQEFSRSYPYYLKLDVRRYFDSIPHDRLQGFLHRRVKDTGVLELFSQLITAYEASLGVGLPIGSLTSQHLANFYLGWLDRFVKQQLRVKGYVRYMDDMVLWSESREKAKDLFEAIREFAANSLELTLKPPVIRQMSRGLDFLGCRITPHAMTLSRRSKRRFRRRLSALWTDLRHDKISEIEFQQRSLAVVEFTRAGGVSSWKFRRNGLKQYSAGG